MDAIGWVVLAIVLLLIVLNVVVRIVQRRQLERDAAEHDKYARWRCPNCEQAFGETVHYIHCGGIRRHAIVGVLIVCPHCQFFNRYTLDGQPEFGKGEFHDPDKYDRWERGASTLACPRCGTCYVKWSGIVAGMWDENGKLVDAPIMACDKCGKESKFREIDGQLIAQETAE